MVTQGRRAHDVKVEFVSASAMRSPNVLLGAPQRTGAASQTHLLVQEHGIAYSVGRWWFWFTEGTRSGHVGAGGMLPSRQPSSFTPCCWFPWGNWRMFGHRQTPAPCTAPCDVATTG